MFLPPSIFYFLYCSSSPFRFYFVDNFVKIPMSKRTTAEKHWNVIASILPPLSKILSAFHKCPFAPSMRMLSAGFIYSIPSSSVSISSKSEKTYSSSSLVSLSFLNDDRKCFLSTPTASTFSIYFSSWCFSMCDKRHFFLA